VATHVWFAAQAVLLVVIAPYAFIQLQLTPFELGLVLGIGGIGALAGAALSTTVGSRLWSSPNSAMADRNVAR
jgi:hypothetical protein